MITAAQALNALYHLRAAADDAVVMHYVSDISETRCAHKSVGLEENFRKAAEALGYTITEKQSANDEAQL